MKPKKKKPAIQPVPAVPQPPQLSSAQWQKHRVAGLVMLLVWLIWWWPVILGSEQLYIRDLTFYALPMKTFMMERFLAGEFPFWTQQISGGMPFFAEPSHQVLYPFNLLFFLTPTIQHGISWFVILHHLLALFGFYALSRTLGAGRGLALWGALIYGMSGYTLSVLDNVNYLTAIAWVPLALCFFIRGLRHPHPKESVFAGVCVAMMVLAGDTFHPMYLALFCGLLVLFRSQSARPDTDTPPESPGLFPGANNRFAWLHLGLSFGLGGLLAAIQILPTWELLQHSVRQEALSFEEATLWSFPPPRLIELLHPFFFGSKYPQPHFIGVFLYPRFNEPWAITIYLGIIPLLLGAYLAFTQRKQAILWLGLALGGLILGAGQFAPYYPALLEWFPPLNFHRYPEKFVFFMNFGLCVAALLGACHLMKNPDLLWNRLEPHGKKWRIILTLILLIGTPFLLLKIPADQLIWPYAMFRSEEWGTSFFYDREQHMIGLFHHWVLMLALLTPLLWLQKSWYRPYFKCLLIVAVMSLCWAHFRHVPTILSELAIHRPHPAALQIMEQDRNRHQSSPASPENPDSQEKKPLRFFYDDAVRIEENKREPSTLRRVSQAYGIEPTPTQSYPVYWPYRVLFNQQRLLFNFGILYGAGYQNGRFAPLQPKHHKQMDDVLLRMDPGLLMALSGVEYVVSSIKPGNANFNSPHFSEAGKAPPFNLRVLRVNNTVPRAYLAPNSVWNDSPMAVYKILTPEFNREDLQQVVELSPSRLLNPKIPTAPDENFLSPAPIKTVPPKRVERQPDRVTLKLDKPGFIKLQVENPYDEAHLVVTEGFFPGWRAWVDGEPAGLFLANQRFMAVPIPAGTHEIMLRYHPTLFLPGLLLSLLGLGLAVSLCLLPRYRPEWLKKAGLLSEPIRVNNPVGHVNDEEARP